MSADQDGDSEMLSSSESSQSSPQTPTAFPTLGHSANFPGSELSPPGSQDAIGAESSKMAYDDSHLKYVAGASSQQPGGDSSGGVGGVGGDEKWEDQSAAISQTEPGASWNNKKAEEEYQRAMELVVDQDFSLKEFGDPFDDKDMTEG
ncbi:hypothetical protein ACO22_01266 [Paracoccidioides brasiliensis]|uniref:Uncharacterized protein n=1 Tax=Paracoccidioides brasiliensis TaxID=121759 RepID=A0A1D2JM34_PARBR|nr:hypothetical protein ACO22_01266 [Paracoccidioides brasiliensis]